mgnify:CR=1 FL=1
MKEKTGSFRFHIESYVCDFMGKATLPVLGNFMLQAATIHAQERGFGFDDLQKDNAAWVLSRISIRIEEYPNHDETITVETWVEDVSRSFTQRCFSFIDSQGRVFGDARSIWAAIDIRTRRPMDIPSWRPDLADYIVPDKVCLAEKPAKIPAVLGVEASMGYTVRYSDRYYDVRTFGAVMDTGDYKCGQVRGPVQLCFGRSVDAVLPQEITITRMAVTNVKEKDAGDDTKKRTMGRKYSIPYALYRMEGFVSPAYAEKTGFDEKDLALLWEALLNMFELDHSAARGRMATRKLYVFEHESKLGNAPSYALFDAVHAAALDPDKPARRFEDYQIAVDAPPAGVTLHEMR